jgi:dTDP-4-amino-4,6-dideoxygalactose transaminase
MTVSHQTPTLPARTPPSDWRDLAVAGAPPLFDTALHVGRPNVPEPSAFLDRLAGALDRARLTNDGPLVREFEEAVCSELGVAHCVAMASGTAALELAIEALGLAGEVIVPAFTFVATAHALERRGARPVFGDVHPDTYTLDPARVEALIGPRTTGVLGVHVWGRACAPEDLEEIAGRHGLHLLFDAAQAFGCSHRGRMLGTYGRAEVLSFHATKVVTTFEGGAVVTGDAELAERLRQMRNFGFDGDGRVRRVGTNAKLNEAAAAMGLASLAQLSRVAEVNRRNLEGYRERLGRLPGVRVIAAPEQERHSFHYVVAEVDEGEARLSRDELAAVLWLENVLVRRYFHPGCHRVAPYRDRPSPPLPVTDRLGKRVLSFPTGDAVDLDTIGTVSRVLEVALNSPQEVRSAVRGRAGELRFLLEDEAGAI